MIRRGFYILCCAALASSCASKKTTASIQALETENKMLRSDITKLQEQLVTMSNDLLVVQGRIQHQNLSPVASAPAAPIIRPVTEAPKKMFRQDTFLGDEIQFTDDEPPVTASGGGMKFTNKDLDPNGVPVIPSKSGTSAAPVATKSKSGNFSETTLIDDNTKAATKNTEDPAITGAYNQAYKTFTEQNYRETIRLMGEFLKQYPSHQYSDNAVFWTGESYYQLKNYEQANSEFEKVVTKYPNGNKVPDAMLRSGICMLKLSKPEKAKSSFDQLIKKYPESVAARKAKASLGEL